jgi:aspartyl/asparaginyl-tRNA synthetase
MRGLTKPSQIQQENHLSYLQSDEAQAIFRLSQVVTDLLRRYLGDRGFIEFLPPVVSSGTDPGLRGAERLPVSLYDRRAYVTSSMVFHKPVLPTAFSRIYAFAPNVWLEPMENGGSGRHLVEFCQRDLRGQHGSGGKHAQMHDLRPGLQLPPASLGPG